MYRQFVRQAHRLLRERDLTLRLVDVGARNGVTDLADLAPFVDAIGFEPNPDEYRKLVTGSTDAAVVGQRTPRYRSLEHSPLALGAAAGRLRFFITRGAGAAGLLEPDVAGLQRIRWKGREFAKGFGAEVFAVDREVEVDVVTLRDFAGDRGILYIDLLKIDTEGSEYDVLTGAGDLLERTGVVKVEVCFVQMRHGQRLFSEVDLLMRARGFELLRYEVLPEQVGFKERTRGWTFGSSLGIPERFGQPLQAEAIYVNERVTDPARALAQALVLLDLRYVDEAMHVLRTRAEAVGDPLLRELGAFRGTLPHRAADAAARVLMVIRRLASPGATLRRWRGWKKLRARGARPPA